MQSTSNVMEKGGDLDSLSELKPHNYMIECRSRVEMLSHTVEDQLLGVTF